MGGFKWIKPEVYPLFVAVGAAIGLCGFAIARNLAINPDVRINKDDRAAGVLENFKEGKSYKDHGLRKYVHGASPEIMPAINGADDDDLKVVVLGQPNVGRNRLGYPDSSASKFKDFVRTKRMRYEEPKPE